MSIKTVYLVSGSNRGIGYTLTAASSLHAPTQLSLPVHTTLLLNRSRICGKAPNVPPSKIQKTAGHLDVVITNAGIAKYYGTLATTHSRSCAQALLTSPTARQNLRTSPPSPPHRAFLNFSGSTYGSSKAAANYLVKALDVENPSLVMLALVSVEDSVVGILAHVDAATKETSGRFWNYSSETGGKPLEVRSDEIAW
ncbi:hypothetical protein B0H14DRAFT_3435334 [Mycena olivaceomarginata]|nr:hypothetical protein B0H14DRAFT_3435334 [Mycena olivaceomarginata]